MNEKFFDLSREKQDRMINGALEVFAKNGYKHASTDDMVKAVDVSKGLWFHYFGSKAGLYTFVYGYSVKYMLLELSTVVDANEKDYFEIVKQMEYTKMRVSRNYPYMNLFLDKAMQETDEEILEQTAADRRMLKEKMDSILKNGELNGVEEKTQRDRIKKMVRYTIDGIVRDKTINSQAEPESIYREVKHYIDLLKKMVMGTDFKVKEETSSVLQSVAS